MLTKYAVCDKCGERIPKGAKCRYVIALEKEIAENPNPVRLPHEDVPIQEGDRTPDLYEELTGERDTNTNGMNRWNLDI